MVIIVFLFVLLLLPVGINDNVAGQTLIVRCDGDGNYTSIQEAIDAANPGDTVYVWSGTYYETVAINKTITLYGMDRNITIIDSNNEFYAVVIQASDVTLSGFTIKNNTVGIYVGGNESNSNVTITNNIITKNKDGIYLGNKSNDNTVFGNIIIENDGDGIRLYGSIENEIYENTITDHNSYGIVLWDSSYNNIISKNIIFNNRNGVGLRRWSDNNVISENNVTKNKNSGIIIAFSYYNNLTSNTVTDNGNGISINDASENFISKNYIANNHRGIYLYDSTDNIIDEDNVFLDNDEDISEGSKTFKTPGFELIFPVFAMLFILLKRRQ